MYKNIITFCFINILLFNNIVLCDIRVVETTHGKVLGKKIKTLLNGDSYYGFMGIPYAKPPVNELRFLPPQALDSWPQVLETTKEKEPCIQFNWNIKKGQPFGLYGQEDCLYLDIFTPELDNTRRPVIVFLYNEYFRNSYNKTKDYAPDFFIEENVVIATISHRLAVFGFLSLEDDTLQGNGGLKDIVSGLQWISNNIDRFGGDPNRITLMGAQGGAAAVDLLIHSKARHLFRSAILQSGTSLFSMYLQEGTRERAFKLAELLDCGTGNSNTLVKHLNEIRPEDLLAKELNAISKDYNKEQQRGLLPFGPIVEREGLITQYPESSQKIDLPVMIGFNSREGLEISLEFLIEHRYLSFVQKYFVLLMPWRVGFNFDPIDDTYEDAINDLKKFYFQNGKVTINSVPEYITYSGDYITSSIDRTVQFYSNISTEPVYYYYFDYYSDLNDNKNDLMKLAETKDGTWGAATGDELCYLFKCPSMKDQYLRYNKAVSEEMVVLRKMVKMWTDFAKYSNPTPESSDVQWPSYNMDTKQYLHIGRTMEVKEDLCGDRFRFWEEFVKKWEKKIKESRKNDEL